MCVILAVVFSYCSGWLRNEDTASQWDKTKRSIQEESNEADSGGEKGREHIHVHALSRHKVKFMYPGTKWCGTGNIAESYEDLGSARVTDMCCRAHDRCPDVIKAGETRHGLKNDGLFTRLSCACDEQFLMCLRTTGGRKARNIGVVYFNGLDAKCFRKDYPVLGCIKRGRFLRSKCLKPKYDTEGEQRYQWFDVPKY